MDVSLILPIYCAEDFLQHTLIALDTYLTQLPGQQELVLVVDGSPDRSLEICQTFAQHAHPYAVQVLQNPQNLGKGGAIQRGMLAATGQYRVFTDCDLAYPVEEITKILTALRTGCDLAIGVRGGAAPLAHDHTHDPHMVWIRKHLSRVFNRLVRWFLDLPISDTQSGLKGFTAAAGTRLFSQLRLLGFSFDVELLVLATRSGLTIREVPVECHYRPQSTIKFGIHGLEMLRDLLKVWWRARTHPS